MGKDTAIEWAHHTFNPWWGCQRVSPGCEHCYAETFAKRVGQKVWGPTSPRRFFGDSHWHEPLKWAAVASAAGQRHRVFCASMADVFEDRRDLDDQRQRLWNLIEATPELDWLLLTKRPENHEMVPLAWQTGTRRPGNLWFGTTTEDQPNADKRIPHLLAAKWPSVRFLSYEPALGPLQLHPGTIGCVGHLAETFGNPLIHWVIVGGESGPGARPFDLAWGRSVTEQCRAAGVPAFFKQAGARPWDSSIAERALGHRCFSEQIVADFSLKLKDRKGGDLSELAGIWPREFPVPLRISDDQQGVKHWCLAYETGRAVCGADVSPGNWAADRVNATCRECRADWDDAGES